MRKSNAQSSDARSEEELNGQTNYKLPVFLQKLYEIVNDDTTNAIISWKEPLFDKFIIHNINSFCKNILP